MSSLTICHRRDTNDLLQGQRSLFSESKLLTLPAGGFGAVFCVHLASWVSTGGGGGGGRGEKGKKMKYPSGCLDRLERLLVGADC